MKIKINNKRSGKRFVECESINVYDANNSYMGRIAFTPNHLGQLSSTIILMHKEINVCFDGAGPTKEMIKTGGDIWYTFKPHEEDKTDE